MGFFCLFVLLLFLEGIGPLCNRSKNGRVILFFFGGMGGGSGSGKSASGPEVRRKCTFGQFIAYGIWAGLRDQTNGHS